MPSRTKIGSGSTMSCGWSFCSSSHSDQWVVTRRPSSSPAAASTKVPLHTAVTRRQVGATAATQPSTSGSRTTSIVPWPPTTMSVSMARSRSATAAAETVRSMPISRPLDDRTIEGMPTGAPGSTRATTSIS